MWLSPSVGTLRHFSLFVCLKKSAIYARMATGAFGMRAEGAFIPASILRRDLATGLNGGGSIIEDTMRGDMLLRVLRPQARVIQVGARVLTGLVGNLRIPRQTAGAEASWQTEQGEASETDVALEDLELSPKRLTAYIDVSKQQLIQSSVEIEAMLRDDLTKAADQLIDFAAINGSGTGNQPLGIRHTPGVGVVLSGARTVLPSTGAMWSIWRAVLQKLMPR